MKPDDIELLYVFREQVKFQCLALVEASETLDRTVQALATADAAPFRVWIAIQNLLTAAANISKALWGSKGRRADDRALLRDLLAVPDDSPLRGVDLRNHFDHYDERIDLWWATGSRLYLDWAIIPPSDTDPDIQAITDRATVAIGEPEGDVPPTDVFKIYVPENGTVLFWGERFKLPVLVEAARDLLAEIERGSE